MFLKATGELLCSLFAFPYHDLMKVVGHRQPPQTPEESLRRAERMIAEAKRLAPHPRSRGFVFKARTWEEYEAWRKAQSNPRLW